MTDPSARIRALARRLLAAEAGNQSNSDANADAAVRVCEKLRISLARLAGTAGYVSLLRRALALARAEVPALQTVKVRPDGSLEGLEDLATGPTKAGDSDTALAITTYLLALLVTFLGEHLTVRLVRNAWPDELLD